MLYQHSFWYRASKKLFEDALKADPTCAIAYWGIAQSLLANPFNPTPAKNLAEGLAAIEQGKGLGAKTQRENDLIAAIGVYYANFESLDQRARAHAYVKAMEDVAARYPGDDEVQIYYSLALNIAAAPSDKTYANQLKAAAILELITKRRPQHPGVAHYLIHTYDYPALAQKGLMRPCATPRLRRPRRTPSTCHPTFSRGWALGRTRCLQHSRRRPGQGRQGGRRSAARIGLHGLCLPAARSRPAARARSSTSMTTITGYNAERNTGPSP